MSRTAESPFSSLICASHLLRSPALHAGHQHFERFLEIADDAHVHADVLVDLGRVDVDVNLPGVRRVRLQVAGDAIVEPHAEREQQIRLLNRRVHPRLAVHPHHAEAERMGRREAADAEQRLRRRDIRLLGERPDDVHGAREHDAVTRENQRALRRIDQLERALELFGTGAPVGPVLRLFRHRAVPVELAR